MELFNALIHTLYTVMNWVPYLLGTGALMWIVLVILAMFFAPFAAILGALSPLLKAAIQFVIWFIRDVLYTGLVDMTDNLSSVLFVLTLVTVAGWWFWNHGNCPAPAARSPYIMGTVKPNTAKPSFVEKYFPKLPSSAKPKPTPATKPVVDDDTGSLVKPFWKE